MQWGYILKGKATHSDTEKNFIRERGSVIEIFIRLRSQTFRLQLDLYLC